MDNKPTVEFAPQTESDSDSSPTWWVMGGIALIAGGAAIVISLPDMWDGQIVGHTGRRGQAISVALEALGYVPTLSILLGITAVSLAIAAVSFIKELRTEGKN